MLVLFIKMNRSGDAFFEEKIDYELEDSEEEEGYETPDEEISLTPIGSPTKYKEDHTDVLTKFFIDDAIGLVDIIERLKKNKRHVTNDELQYNQSQIEDAKINLLKLKSAAKNNKLVQEYLLETFNVNAETIDNFLKNIIYQLRRETRNLMDEADKAGAEVAKKRSDEEHKRRKQNAERIRKQRTNSSDHQSEPTPTCGSDPCIIALRL